MNKLTTIIIVSISAATVRCIPIAIAADVAVPAGFEDIFNAKQQGVLDVIYGDKSIGSYAVEYGQQDVRILSPHSIVEQVTAVDMPALKISKKALLDELSAPLQRVNKQGFADKHIVASLNESDASVRLIFPSSLFKSGAQATNGTFIPHRAMSGFVHSHNANVLSDDYGDSFSFSSTDVLNLTGNSYIKGSWSYADQIDFNLDELALYIESKDLRFKAGRQQLSDNLSDSTPSIGYSFINPMSFDGVSLGYMTDNYLAPSKGAASPVSLYLPQAGSVEIYRNGRMIDLQQFAAGLQYLDTSTWPAGGYNVRLVTKLANGSREEHVQPFFKRSGSFRSGDVEFIIQMGRYDRMKADLSSHSTRGKCFQCEADDTFSQYSDNYFGNFELAYTTSSALSLGGGLMLDDADFYVNSSLDIPLNTWIAERLYLDSTVGRDGSMGYQVGAMKNFYRLGFNASYRDNYYRGDEDGFRQFSIVPRYDYQSIQLSANTFLPGNVGFGLAFGANTFYQNYGRQDKSKFSSWDVTLNRDFALQENMNLRVDLGYHRGMNQFTSQYGNQQFTEDQLFMQLTLGFRERSYNHNQSLYLRSRLDAEDSDSNTYSANYALNLNNPAFDRSGKYSVNASLTHGPDVSSNSSASVVANNSWGYTAAGLSKAFGNDDYKQLFLSQRSGFAIGNGDAAFGSMDNTSSLIIDATDLPADQYFEVRNRNVEPGIVRGGTKTTLPVSPYQKVSPKVEQLFTGKTDAFYDVVTKSTSSWIMPGQAYDVKLSATKNQTVTGRILFNGAPLSNARIIGANSMSDSEGLFVGDFTLTTTETLETLTVKKDNRLFTCPIKAENTKITQGIMQIHEVNCEVQ